MVNETDQLFDQLQNQFSGTNHMWSGVWKHVKCSTSTAASKIKIFKTNLLNELI